MSDDAVAHVTPPADVIQKYEALRTAVLVEGLSLESRNGLALFLRRGMWGWLQAGAAPLTSPRPARCVDARLNLEGEQQAIVQLLAALATRATKRRADERFS